MLTPLLSCTTGTDPCNDTGGGIDLSWPNGILALILAAVILVAIASAIVLAIRMRSTSPRSKD